MRSSFLERSPIRKPSSDSGAFFRFTAGRPGPGFRTSRLLFLFACTPSVALLIPQQRGGRGFLVRAATPSLVENLLRGHMPVLCGLWRCPKLVGQGRDRTCKETAWTDRTSSESAGRGSAWPGGMTGARVD